MNFKKQMLIVDDSQSLREALRMVFEDEFEVKFASDIDEAIKIIENDFQHIVLLDYRIQRMRGINKMKKLCQSIPATRVIVLSTSNDKFTADKARQCGAFEFVGKPFDISQIKTTVSNAYIGIEYKNGKKISNNKKKPEKVTSGSTV